MTVRCMPSYAGALGLNPSMRGSLLSLSRGIRLALTQPVLGIKPSLSH
jgi:hypothetical protein